MNTRHASNSGPLNQNRYMSSPEYAELRGISGTAASTRAAILPNQAHRELIYWVQALSLREGGLKRVAADLVEDFPDRVSDGRAKYCLEGDSADEPEPEGFVQPDPASLELAMIELCVNPQKWFVLPGEARPPKYRDNEFCCRYFSDLPGALLQHISKFRDRAMESIYWTALGKKIRDTADFAQKTRGMALIDGLEGRGKTIAAKAYCAANLGKARFVSLRGVTTKTTAFREIAKALGIANSYTRKASEMQQRIEDFLERSKLMLVIDEAHFAFNQSSRIYIRPEIIDWIVTSLCNRGVPVVLITTPQFLTCMERAAKQVEWNYRQFRRRVKRYVKLAPQNSEADVEAVTRRVFPRATPPALQYILGYVGLSKRDVSALGDVADEVRAIICPDNPESVDLSKTLVTFEHARRAIMDELIPSDTAFAEGLKAVKESQGGRPRRAVALPKPAPAPDLLPLETEEQPVSISSRSHIEDSSRSRGAVPLQGSRIATLDASGIPD